jgi:hypothetical protein
MVCHHDFVVSTFDCLRQLEDALQFVFSREESFVVGTLRLSGAGHDRIQFGLYLSLVLCFASDILLHHICKALHVAIHKGE